MTKLTRRSVVVGGASTLMVSAGGPALAQAKQKLRFSCAFTETDLRAEAYKSFAAAINRLTSEGLVVLRSRRGTYVATLTPTMLRELFETRTMIERWAVEHTPQEALAIAAPAVVAIFDSSTTIIAEADAAHFDYSAYYALDLDLHALVIGLAGTAVLLDLHHAIMARMSVGRIYYPGEDEVLRRSHVAHREHEAIVTAVVRGDRDALLDAVCAHINASMAHTAWLLDRSVGRGAAQ